MSEERQEFLAREDISPSLPPPSFAGAISSTIPHGSLAEAGEFDKADTPTSGFVREKAQEADSEDSFHIKEEGRREPETMEASGTSEIDQFLQRMKCDLMYELRNIQHGEKPVTGQNHREQIQQFMEKYVDNKDNPSSAQPSTSNEDHRPEAVVVEVQGVIEQRRVSSMLQSSAFRRQLENVIRGGIQSHTRTMPVPQPRTNQGTSAPRPLTRARPASSLEFSPRGQAELPQNVGNVSEVTLTRTESTDSISSVDSFSSARSSTDLAVDEEELHFNRENEDSASHQSHSRGSQQNDTGFSNLSWNDISQVHHDELVEEISDLLHSRLVSSTLDGEFRATLEVLFQERVQNSGHNGEAVQNFIQSLPRGGVAHNDFTHLGIPNTDADNLDNISVTNFSAHSVPYTQTNSHLSREIQSLKSQMLEMKNMIKLSCELQMDIQRAIRQEVAAAMHSVTGSGATVSPSRHSQPVSETHCLICLDRHSDSVLYQCGHMCVCYICGKDLISRNLNCPVCRAPIKDVIRAYKTNVE